MRAKVKYYVSVYLAIVLLALMAKPISAKAEEKIKCGENVYGVLENGTLTLEGMGETYDFKSSNPPFYDWRTQIRKVIVSEGITSIGNHMFYLSTSNYITEVDLGNTLVRIGVSAFEGAKVQSIEFPDSLERIEKEASVRS